MIAFDVNSLDWEKGGGLVPAVVQDARSLRVLMLGYVNKESLAETLSSGFVTFYSRSKKRLWKKGESSGNVLRLMDIKADCDVDAVLIMAEPAGPTCHTGKVSCFGEESVAGLSMLADLETTIKKRRANPSPGSYTAELFASGIARIAQKVGEEGVEVALAGATKSDTVVPESADLLYHLLVLLEASGHDLMDVMKVLRERSRK